MKRKLMGMHVISYTQETFISERLSTFRAHVPVDKVSRYKAVKLPSNYEIPEGNNLKLLLMFRF